MSEPILGSVEGTHDENAATPVEQPDQKQTTTTTSDKTVMDLLDIPVEVQARIAPKAEQPKTEETQPELPAEPEPKGDEQPEELKPEEEDLEEEGEEEEVPAAEQAQPQKIDKRSKRINRLTRQKAELEARLDAIAAENYKLRQAQQEQEPANYPAPLVGENLTAINREIAKLDATLEWCDNNAEGGELGEGAQAKYFDAKEIRAWRRDAEFKRQNIVLAQDKELQRLAAVRQQSDQAALSLWPEMFDKSKRDYQEAVAIVRQFPWIATIPEANYYLGVLIEGNRSLQQKAAKNGQPKKQHRDIDERVFTTPRVPIAPHTSEPPTRESKPSSTKRYNEAMSRLINDPDGGVENLAAALAAREAATKQVPSSRSPVRS